MVKCKSFWGRTVAKRSLCARYGGTGVIIFPTDNSVNRHGGVPVKTCKMLFPVFNVLYVFNVCNKLCLYTNVHILHFWGVLGVLRWGV